MKAATLVQFISFLYRQNIEISTDGKQIFCDGSQEALTSEIIEEITERKSDIINFLQRIGSAKQTDFPPIEPVARDTEVLPLSWAQERLWFLTQLEEASATYNMSGAIRLNGNLNLEALQSALSAIARRHEVLRTSFVSVDGTPAQIVNSEVSLKLEVVDLQNEEATEREILVQQQAKSEASTPFDLKTAPLVRCGLLQLDATESVLLLTIHHIISDGWSIGILLRELSVLYSAYAKKEPSPLPELAIQYADFAVWQRQWLNEEMFTKQLNYWQEQLKGLPELLQLPTDRPRPAVQTYQGKTYNFVLNSELKRKLVVLSQRSGTTLFITLKAVFAVLLYRYSGQSDIVIGSPIANRNHREIEPLIGFFANTLVLRTSFEDNPNFKELLAQVRETTLAAYEHQDMPFEKVVEALQPERSLSYSPLFQVMFILQNASTLNLELPGLTSTLLETEGVTAKFDLTLSIKETSSGLTGIWEYNSDLFDSSTIERMAGHFQNLLESIVENPQQKVSKLPLLSEAERHQLLVEWNDTQTEYPQDRCIHQLFEEQVEKTPDAVAVVFEEQQLTYKELNAKANQLAHYLQAMGVEPEVLVGICVERSIEMIVGLLGILKAGGAYVPLDPNYPTERLKFMVEDSQLSLLLTESKTENLITDYSGKTICLNTDCNTIACKLNKNCFAQVASGNLAYVIYTSGSTGKPKGVQIEHNSVVNFFTSMRKEPGISQKDVFIAVTSISFDVAVLELFLPLIVGAKVVFANQSEIANDTKLLRLIAQSHATIMQATPATWRMLHAGKCQEVRLNKIFCGGEAFPSDLSGWLLEQCFSLWNLYGPTEATIWAAVQQVEDTVQATIIGKPIINTQMYILDKNLQPLPIGGAGELYIGGAGLARGYLNCPELTEEKFILNPFSDEHGARLYKTGDKTRYLPNGNIEFLGRLDHQVKIRGFRIELEEIESVLSRHPEVRETVVVAREDVPGDKRLVAYVVTFNKSLVTNQLRKFLKKKLPEYMVPSTFVTLDYLPLTPNGKVDRKALPALDREIIRENEYVAPRTPDEEIIANIFASVLSMSNISVHDNFFELGGHSLLATQVISRIKQAFEVEILLRQMFETPTVAELAENVIKLQFQYAQKEDVAYLLAELEKLSDEEIQKLLAQEMRF